MHVECFCVDLLLMKGYRCVFVYLIPADVWWQRPRNKLIRTRFEYRSTHHMIVNIYYVIVQLAKWHALLFNHFQINLLSRMSHGPSFACALCMPNHRFNEIACTVNFIFLFHEHGSIQFAFEFIKTENWIIAGHINRTANVDDINSNLAMCRIVLEI